MRVKTLIGWYPHVASAFALALLLCGCGHHDDQGASVPPATESAASTLAVAGQLITGDDPAAIRAYLGSVKEVHPSKFEVKWSPDTVAVSRDEAMRSLRAISRDGSAFTFASDEPVVATLRPGSILWIYDIALRRVDRVANRAGTTVLHTSPVALTEAMTQAQIEFDTPVRLADYYMSFRPHQPATTTPTASLFQVAPRRAFRRFALWGKRGGVQTALRCHADVDPATATDDDPEDEDSDEDELDYGEVQPAANGYNGTLKGFDYSVGYSTRAEGITLTLQARKSEGGPDNSDTDKDSEKEFVKKFTEAEKEEREAKKKVRDIEIQLTAEKASLQELDAMHEMEMNHLKADQAARTDPNTLGGRLVRRTDSNGVPYTDAAEQQMLTDQYDRQRSVEVKKMLAVQQIRDEALKRKQDAEAKKQALKKIVGVVKQLFDIVSDNLDLRFKIKADIDNFAVGGAIKVKDGSIDSAATQFKHLRGKVALSYVGRLGKPGNGAVKIPMMDVPIVFNIPIPIEGIPFVVQLGADFNINVFLTGQHATMQFDGNYAFSGDGGFHATPAGADADSTMSDEEPAIADYQAMSPGVSGAVLAIQAPRLGFGLGMMGTSSVAYFDLVHVMTITNAAAVAMGLTSAPCKRITYDAYGHVGVDTKLMPLPIPFVSDKLGEKLSTRKELFHKGTETLDPPVKACEI